MAFDPSVISDIGASGPDLVGSMAKGFQLKDMVDTSQLNQLKLNSLKSEQADDQKAKSILSKSNLQTSEGLAKAQEELNKAGLAGKSMELRKYSQAVQSGDLDNKIKMVELHSAAVDVQAGAIDKLWTQASAMKNEKTPDGRPKYTDAAINAFIQGQVPLHVQDIQNAQLPPEVKQEALGSINKFLGSGQPLTFDALNQMEQASKQGQAHIKSIRDDLLKQSGADLDKRRENAYERNVNSEISARERSGAGKKAPAGFEWDPEKPDELRPIKGGPKDPNSKPWSGREKVYAERIMGSAREAAADLQNVVELPVGASTGMLGIGGHSGSSIIGTSFGALKNEMSSQEVQDYNVMISGIQRNLSAIESMGLAPSGSLTNQMESVVIKPGDSQLTKLRRLAQTKQIIEKGLDTPLSDPAIPDVMKDAMRETVANVTKAVPFTQHDITELERRAQKNPKATLQDVMKKDGLSGGPTKISSDADYDALPSGAEFIAPDGSRRKKP